MVAASFLMGSSRDLSIHPRSRRQPFSAQVREVNDQSLPACSLIAQARAVLSDALVSAMNQARLRLSVRSEFLSQ